MDAHAVAKLIRDEGATLPRVTAEDAAAVLDLLVTEREAARGAATRLRTQLHQQMLQLDPAYTAQILSLTTEAGLRVATSYVLAQPTRMQQRRIGTIRRLVQRLRLTVEQTATLATQIGQHVTARYLPLTELHGVQFHGWDVGGPPRAGAPLHE